MLRPVALHRLLNHAAPFVVRTIANVEDTSDEPPASVQSSNAMGARRGDAESVNRALEDTLYLNRAHSEGHLRQTADRLGSALMVNSLTLARHRAREAVRTAA